MEKFKFLKKEETPHQKLRFGAGLVQHRALPRTASSVRCGALLPTQVQNHLLKGKPETPPDAGGSL